MRGTTLCVLLTAVHLGASPVLVGLLAALFNAPVVFTSVAMGRVFDRGNARLPLLIAALVMSAGTVTAFLWGGLWPLFVVSLAVGTGYNVFVVGGHQQVGRHGGPADKVANYSMSMQANSLANFIAPIITGFAIDGIGHAIGSKPRFTIGISSLGADLLLPETFNRADDCSVPLVHEGGRWWFVDTVSARSVNGTEGPTPRTVVEAGDRLTLHCGSAAAEILFAHCATTNGTHVSG